jgi:hypothetical protein
LSYKDKRERHRIHQHVYKGSWWVDLDSIDAEAAELLAVDPAQAERFFGNRIVAGSDAAFDPERWAELATSRVVPARDWVTLGFDGARFYDSTAIVATHVMSGYQWLHGLWERPENAPDDWQIDADEVNASMEDAFTRYRVWRLYADPFLWQTSVEQWAGKWGQKRVIEWLTNRNKPMAYALRSYATAIAAGDLSHDGNPDFARHIGNARKVSHAQLLDDEQKPLWTISKDSSRSPLKIDIAMAAVLSWEARGDAVAAGYGRTRGAAGF